MSNLKLTSQIILEGSTKEIIQKCIADNTFENPIFLSNEQNHRSNWNTSPTIETYCFEGENLVLPRGYARDLLNICHENDITPNIQDDRISQPCTYPNELKGIVLRPYQQRAVESAMKYEQGVVIAPTGSGKSLTGLEIIRQHMQKALLIVHRQELALQWAEVIKERLGIEPGMIVGDSWTIGEQITIGMTQTLASRENDTKAISNLFGCILIDEAHHTPSSTFFDVIGLFEAKFRYGLSASPNRRDGLEMIIYRSLGPIIEEIARSEVEGVEATVPVTVVAIETGFDPGQVNSWHEYLDSLTCNAERNILIISLTQQSYGATLILVDRTEHAEQLSDMMKRREIDHILAHGNLSKKDRSEAMGRIKTSKVTIGTSSLLGEGLDVASWGTLIMGSPISSEIKLLQNIGRIVRSAPGKEKAVVFDLKDRCAFSGASFNKRFEIYRKNKIWVEFVRNKKAAMSSNKAA